MNALKNFSLSLTSLIVTFILLEIGVRVFAPGSYHNQNERTYDPEIGYKFLPGLDMMVDTGKGEHHLITNEYGFVGESFPMEKPAGEWRIANIGDSYTEGLQEVDWDKNYVSLIGKRLQESASSSRTFRSLNFGISGRGTLEEYWSYEYLARKASPDMVIVWFTLSNDLGNNYLPPQTPEARATNAYGKIKYILKKSALFSLVFERIKGNPVALRLLQKFHLTNAIVEANGADNVTFQDKINYSKDPSFAEKQAQAYATTEDLLVRFKDSVEADGGKFLVVLIPHFISEADFEAKFPALYPAAKPEEYDFHRPVKRLKEMFEKNGIAFYDLTDDFSSYTEGRHPKFKDCGEIFGDHFTPCGHQIAAELIGDHLLERYLR